MVISLSNRTFHKTVYCSLPLVAQPLQRSSLHSISLLASKAVAVHCVGHQEGVHGPVTALFLVHLPYYEKQDPPRKGPLHVPFFLRKLGLLSGAPKADSSWPWHLISNTGESERITGFSAALFQHLFSPPCLNWWEYIPHPVPFALTSTALGWTDFCNLSCCGPVILLFFCEPHILDVGDKGDSQFLLFTSFIAIIVSFLVTQIRFCSLLLHCKKQSWRDGMGGRILQPEMPGFEEWFLFFSSPWRGKSSFSLAHLKSANFGEIPVQVSLQNKPLDNLSC